MPCSGQSRNAGSGFRSSSRGGSPSFAVVDQAAVPTGLPSTSRMSIQPEPSPLSQRPSMSASSALADDPANMSEITIIRKSGFTELPAYDSGPNDNGFVPGNNRCDVLA